MWVKTPETASPVLEGLQTQTCLWALLLEPVCTFLSTNVRMMQLLLVPGKCFSSFSHLWKVWKYEQNQNERDRHTRSWRIRTRSAIWVLEPGHKMHSKDMKTQEKIETNQFPNRVNQEKLTCSDSRKVEEPWAQNLVGESLGTKAGCEVLLEE